ncbi:hypothetical protein CC78DRAFT_595287 [Lojkania enalia]|uniref:Uncharacterized protein n=1 Tax=Lojkania enalia TaxID=147567 RepID=A0A9P4KCE9_9PLEO|nr:hypothetical protein CC78DRAFT_595287 [Didymosphaeria enalia]
MLLSYPTKVFNTKSYQDLHTAHPLLPYQNPGGAATTPALPRQPATIQGSEAAELDLTALPAKKFKHKLSNFFRPFPKPTTTTTINANPPAEDPPKLALSRLTKKLKAPFKGLRWGKKKKAKKISIGTPMNFRHEGTWSVAGLRDEQGEYARQTQAQSAETQEGDSVWEDIEENDQSGGE